MRRFRKISLRLVLFVVMPICAIGFWDPLTGDKFGKIRVNIDGDRMMFTPDGRFLIVAVRADSIDPAYR